MNKQKIKKLLGIPLEQSFEDDLKRVVSKFRIVLFLYVLIWIFYLVLFVFLKDYTYCYMGRSFGESYSASLLEDLIFFLIIGFGVTLVSIIASNQSPESHDFGRRVSSVINSDDASNNPHVKSFFSSSLSGSLVFYKKMECKITINQFHAEKKAFLIFLEREQVLTNMCRDQPYNKIDNSVVIESDLEINGTYGRLDYMETVSFPKVRPFKIRVNDKNAC